jgi:hypothetical protein
MLILRPAAWFPALRWARDHQCHISKVLIIAISEPVRFNATVIERTASAICSGLIGVALDSEPNGARASETALAIAAVSRATPARYDRNPRQSEDSGGGHVHRLSRCQVGMSLRRAWDFSRSSSSPTRLGLENLSIIVILGSIAGTRRPK